MLQKTICLIDFMGIENSSSSPKKAPQTPCRAKNKSELKEYIIKSEFIKSAASPNNLFIAKRKKIIKFRVIYFNYLNLKTVKRLQKKDNSQTLSMAQPINENN